MKYLTPIIISLNIIFDYLFINAGGIYFLMVLYCVDFILGVAKSIRFSILARRFKKEGLVEAYNEVKDKVLVSKKFPRFLLSLLSALLILTLLKFMGLNAIVFVPLYSIFYSIFIGGQFISIVENLGEMELVSTELVKKVKQKITERIKF
ncbi:phage holin family protein [Litoribacter ruber]|uniref:phage holin family protein n=1 Tax=Litoribacter ruber TaxID=702568 RepID=UPI001BD2072C|nr:phage holin family protein [Litoribacter alkaliphilus]